MSISFAFYCIFLFFLSEHDPLQKVLKHKLFKRSAEGDGLTPGVFKRSFDITIFSLVSKYVHRNACRCAEVHIWSPNGLEGVMSIVFFLRTAHSEQRPFNFANSENVQGSTFAKFSAIFFFLVSQWCFKKGKADGGPAFTSKPGHHPQPLLNLRCKCQELLPWVVTVK